MSEEQMKKIVRACFKALSDEAVNDFEAAKQTAKELLYKISTQAGWPSPDTLGDQTAGRLMKLGLAQHDGHVAKDGQYVQAWKFMYWDYEPNGEPQEGETTNELVKGARFSNLQALADELNKEDDPSWPVVTVDVNYNNLQVMMTVFGALQSMYHDIPIQADASNEEDTLRSQILAELREQVKMITSLRKSGFKTIALAKE